MEERAVKSWLDIAPEYLSFLLTFLRNPRKAFEKAKSTSKVSSDLSSILLGGVALSYLILTAAPSPALKEDPGNIAKLLRKLDYPSLPVVALLATVAMAVVSHAAVKLYSLIGKLSGGKRSDSWSPKVGGTVEDSVNAALGFAAVYIPLTSAAVCGIPWLPSGKGVGAVGLLLAIFALIYFPWSLSSTHRDTGFFQAFFAFCGGMALVYVTIALMGGR